MHAMPFDLNLERSILETISYTDQFQFPLSTDEIYARLCNRTAEKCKKYSQQEVADSLTELIERKFLVQKKHSIALRHRESVFAHRLRRKKIADQKSEDVKQFLKAVSWIPWIQGIFVTGSLAMENTDEDDDLDFMIVTLPRRLWLTRFFVLIVAIFYGKRRSWHEKKHQGWCLNLWLDTKHLTVPREKRSMYQAYEVTQAKCVLSRNELEKKFVVENSWVLRYLPNSLLPHLSQNQHVHSKKHGGLFFDMIDYVAWKLQMYYMAPHKTSERVARSFAFFHPRDTQHLVEERWQQTLQKLYDNYS